MSQIASSDLESHLLAQENVHPINSSQRLRSQQPKKLWEAAIVLEYLEPWCCSFRYHFASLCYNIIKALVASLAVIYSDQSSPRYVWLCTVFFLEGLLIILVIIKLIMVLCLKSALYQMGNALRQRERILNDKREVIDDKLKRKFFISSSKVTRRKTVVAALSFLKFRCLLALYTISGVIVLCSSGVSPHHKIFNISITALVCLEALPFITPLFTRGFYCMASPILSLLSRLIISSINLPRKIDHNSPLAEVIEFREDLPGESKCSICKVSYQGDDRIIQFGCNPSHHFHYYCGIRWATVTDECPICKQQVRLSRSQ